MAKKVTINGSNLLSSTQDAWGGQNTTQYSQNIHGTTVPPGAEWGMNRGEVERFIKSSINAQQSRVGYYVCDNSASTSAKAVVASGYQLAIGGCIKIKMTNANTANNVTLNINSTGAKALYYGSEQASSSNSWEAGEVLEVYYDGTQYKCASSGKNDDEVVAPVNVRNIDLSSISNSSLGIDSSNGTITDMRRGYYAKYIPVTEGCIYEIYPAGSGYRVSMATFKTLPTAAGQVANLGSECMDQYGKNNPVGELGESMKINIVESSYIYVRADTASGAPSRAGSAVEYTFIHTIDEDDSISLVLQKKDGTQVLPITSAKNVKYGDSDIEVELDTIESDVGTHGSKNVQTQNSSFEQGAISGGNDASADNCMRTPSSSPITVNGNGIIKCVFTVPKPLSSSPWSKPYFYKDGALVDDTYMQLQVNNGTVWEYYCDGSFNQIRWRVYVSSIAEADISASSIACSFVENGTGILGDIDKLQSNEDSTVELYLGGLVQSSANGYGALFDDNANYVCMKDAIQVPYNGMTIKAKLPNNIKAAIRLGAYGNNDLATRIWLGNGCIYSVPPNYNYYQIVFGIVNTSGTPVSTIALADVNNYIANGQIRITYQVKGEPNILRSRPDAEIRCRAFKTQNGLPTFCHTSDQHGNYCGLMSAYSFSEYIGVDALINTGDVCCYEHRNGYDYAQSLAQKYTSFPTIVAAGNHDGYNASSEADIRSEFIDKFITAGYHISAGKTFYYYDLPTKNIRFIMLNSSQTGYSTWNDSGCMMQDQIDFLVSTLMSVPDGYGVIIGVHFPLVRKNLMIPNDYGFINDWQASQWEKTLPFATSLLAIIDAYIGRTTFSISYTNDGTMNEGSGTSVSKTGDFSTANGEFICWMTGHTHQDRVAFFADTTYKQLCLNITCTASSDNQASYDSIPRKGDGVCRNAFNIYSIDMTAKKVYIVRIGSDFTEDGIDRKFAIISYAD